MHKTANVLGKMAKTVQAGAKARLHEIRMAPTRTDDESDREHVLDGAFASSADEGQRQPRSVFGDGVQAV
ncbi:MAG: hypothetical protein GY842_05015 [bacterium]|nr:hypothetical protein [bacterium]